MRLGLFLFLSRTFVQTSVKNDESSESDSDSDNGRGTIQSATKQMARLSVVDKTRSFEPAKAKKAESSSSSDSDDEEEENEYPSSTLGKIGRYDNKYTKFRSIIAYSFFNLHSLVYTSSMNNQSLGFAKVRVYKDNDRSAPFFPSNFSILQHDVLQVTNFNNNNNKYYSLELHEGTQNSRKYYRLYSHYGRSDDLLSNPNAGRKECRYCDSLQHAQVRNRFSDLF